MEGESDLAGDCPFVGFSVSEIGHWRPPKNASVDKALRHDELLLAPMIDETHSSTTNS
jgi:hypothetical protein